jgi:hypothetical protein
MDYMALYLTRQKLSNHHCENKKSYKRTLITRHCCFGWWHSLSLMFADALVVWSFLHLLLFKNIRIKFIRAFLISDHSFH